ncbi:MAG: hypothetical protein ABIP94_22770, partial [Planctomycetota bacterium]
RVLALLSTKSNPLSHVELAELLGRRESEAIDRVTLYRVLDWLVSVGLAHKILGHDRVFRFAAEDDSQPALHAGNSAAQAAIPAHRHDLHAHFECETCHTLVCIDDMALPAMPPKKALPRGFEGRSVEILVRGVCAACRD